MSLVTATLIAGRYQLDHQLATDRFGEVWRGTDVELARPVAVKLLHADAGDADAIRQFRAAARRAASLSHEGLVRVFDYCDLAPSDSSESSQRPFLVMEFVDGQSLASQLQTGPLGTARTVDIVAQATAALAAVHRAGLAHGDIRPEKILLSPGGAAKLFGFSGTVSGGPAAIGADLRALGRLAEQCLNPKDSGMLAGQLPASVTDLVAELRAHPPADQPHATAVIARRAAALAAELGEPAAADRGCPAPSASPSPTSWVPDLGSSPSTQPLAAGQPHAKRGRLGAVGAVSLIAIALAVIAVVATLKPNGSAPGLEGLTKAASVRVTAARLIDRPVNVVRLRLRRLGLVVRIRWRESDTVSAGDVIAVRPTGLVPAHSVVVIVGSTGRSATGPDVGQARAPHRHRPRSATHKPASAPPTPKHSPSASSSSTSAPSPSPSNSPTPSSSPTSSQSPPASSSPPNSPPPSPHPGGNPV